MSPDPWHLLRGRTAARIALGRAGGSLPTHQRLDFQLAHARARDAVLSAFDAEALAARLGGIAVESAAATRADFLRRPDLGRALAAASRGRLAERATTWAPCDLVIVVSDGLSTLAVETQSEPLCAALLPRLRSAGWKFPPPIVARHARVALQDEIGDLFRASLSLILLGERPGLGNADSLGAYLTYGPKPGRTDAERNCVSNIREGGLPPAVAAAKLHWLLEEARRRSLSGVPLKDDAPAFALEPPAAAVPLWAGWPGGADQTSRPEALFHRP